MKTFARILPVLFLLSVFSVSCSLLKKGEKTRTETKIKTEEEFYYDAHFLEGLRLKMLGKYEQASIKFEKARQYIDDEAPLYYELAEVNSQLGYYATARQHAKKAVELDEENIWYNILLVQLYQNAGLFANASEAMEQIIELKPNRLEYYFMLSSLYQSIGEPKDAIKTMKEAEKRFGITDVISIEKERLYQSMDKPDKAIDEIKALSEAYPGNAQYKALLAELYIDIGDKTKAQEIYDELENTENLKGDILLSISQFYQQTAEYDKAYDYLKQAFACEDMDVDVKIEMLVSLLTTTGTSEFEVQKQRELFNTLVRTHPAEPKALTVYSDFLVKVEEYDEAVTVIKQVLESNRDKYLIWEQMLYIQNQLGDFETMYQYADTITTLFPHQPLPYLYGSVAAFQTECFDKCVEYAKKGLKLPFDNKQIKIELLTFLGETYEETGKHELADSTFEKILKIDPENTFVLNNYAYYLSLREQNLAKAKKMSERLIEIEADNPSYQDTYGWILYKLENYKEALTYIKKAYNSGGNSRPAIVEHYGDALYKNGRKDDAVMLWKAALQLYDEKEPTKALKQKIETGKLIDE
ncbi:MAG: tetratricopeptide repeat protein [Bacteroidota bacterium]|nr:tetratricopeptide repeat protein [Bacteroidota bacterium]